MKHNIPTVINMGQVRGVEGKWLVVVKNKVVASSDDAEEMFRVADKYTDEDVVVTKVLSAHASFY